MIKKKILCIILTFVMLLGIMPIAVFAEALEGESSPVVKVESMYQYDSSKDESYNMNGWAKPDAANVFYFKISIENTDKLEKGDEINVYYKTVDHSAVAEWGDYDAVGTNGDTYVTLKESNKYSQVVTVESRPSDYRVKLVEDEFTMDTYEDHTQRAKTTPRYIGRIFFFDIYEVEGNASLPDSNSRRVTALLNAEYEFSAGFDAFAKIGRSQIKVENDKYFYNIIDTSDTPVSKGVTGKSIQLGVSEEYKKLVDSGVYKPYMYITGGIHEGWFEHDEEVHFTLFYYKNGVRIPAIGIDMEGEFDDYKIFGPEYAFGYYHDKSLGRSPEHKDFISDNFRGFTLYNNDGSVKYKVKYNSVDGIAYDMNQAMRRNLVRPLDKVSRLEEYGNRDWGMFSMVLPEDFVHSSTFDYTFSSDGGNKRYLEGVDIVLKLATDKAPKLEVANGKTLIKTNLDTIQKGEKIQLTMRFDTLTTIVGEDASMTIKAKLSGVKSDYNIEFKRVNCNTNDTWIFEADMPESAANDKLTAITNLKMVGGERIDTIHSNWLIERSGHLTWDSTDLTGITLLGYNTDLRDAVINVTTLSPKDLSVWSNQAKVKLSVTPYKGTGPFSDKVTIYYKWSSSKDLPTSYDAKIVFDYKLDHITEKTITGGGNGETYLHLKAVTRYGSISYANNVSGNNIYRPDIGGEYIPYGPYLLDNEPPSFSKDNYSIEQAQGGWKYTITPPVDNGSGTTSLKLYNLVETVNADGTVTSSVNLVKEFTSFTEEKIEYLLTAEALGIENGQIKEVMLYWIVGDKLNNTSQALEKHTLRFDTNAYIGILSAAPESDQSTETVDLYTFIKNGKSSSFKFNFVPEQVPDSTGKYAIRVVDPIKNKSYIRLGEFLTYTESENKFTATIDMSQNVGLYNIAIAILDENGEEIQASKPYSIYVTVSGSDETPTQQKIEAGTLLINRVYQISTKYYYLDKSGNLVEEYYNGERLPASFSSSSVAYDYVYYMELQDLYLVKLDDTLAAELNRYSSNIYQKAEGNEHIEALAGDHWIRYKASTWEPENASIDKWCYYYYGDSTATTLQTSAFSSGLKAAIETVSNRIVEKASVVALTDSTLFRGSTGISSHLDKQGRPYLRDTQIHFSEESSKVTKCGNMFNTFFSGDGAIFNSENESGNIVGGFTLPSTSRFRYRENSDDAWKNGTGSTFYDMFAGDTRTGIYYIQELAQEGVCEYPIFVDKSAPKLSFFWVDADGGTNSDVLSNSTRVSARSVTIRGLIDDDDFAYIAIYRASDDTFLGMYTKNDIATLEYILSNGVYTVIVADRSGNRYRVDVSVSDTPLECKITEVENKYIRLTCNRKDSNIKRYEIYRNGKLETSSYSAEATFRESGLYRIYVEDIYGNIYEEEYQFNRDYPTVTWKYLGADGKYHEYNANDKSIVGFNMTQYSENEYQISSSTKQRFSFDGNYAYEFIGIVPNSTPDVLGTTVTIDAGQSFKLKVYYKDFPELYTIYSSVVDVTPPTISVSTEFDIARCNEYDLFSKIISDFEDRDIIEIEDIGYSVTESRPIRIANGDTVTSDMIKVNVTDINGLSSVKIYLNDKLLHNQDAESKFPQVVLSRIGSYKIVAVDSLGNTAEFNFKNGEPDEFGYFVDGKKQKIELHNHLNFELVDGKNVYKKVEYGNKDFALTVKNETTVFMKLTPQGENGVVYGFGVANGALFALMYSVIEEIDDDSGEPVKVIYLLAEDILLDPGDSDIKKNTEYVIISNAKYTIYASILENGDISLRVATPENDTDTLTIEARIEFDGSEFFYVKSMLSKKQSQITLNNENGNVIKTDLSGNEICINSGFSIDEAFFASEYVTSVFLYFSTVNDLDVENLDKNASIYQSGATYYDEGFYLLKVINAFGNESIYRISLSSEFNATATAEFKDGFKLYYTSGYAGTVYSDNKIVLDAHALDVKIEALRNGESYTPVIKVENNVTYVIFSEDGKYTVTVCDSYGNMVVKAFEINSSESSFNESLLYGYNDKALKKDEGYTNQMLSVDKQTLVNEGMYYFAIKLGDKLDVIYDTLSETKIPLDDAKLVNAVGKLGDGVYTVIFRNRYGALISKDIHYRATPTLTLQRITKSISEAEDYPISKALEIGFWSNSTLIFNTEAKYYSFTLNGVKTECPKRLAFTTSDESGNNEYTVTYIDEYGFEYTFKAHLVRRDISVELPEDIVGIEIDGILNTKNNISLFFNSDMTAIYTRNGGEAQPYTSGALLKQDGIYRFTVTDYAGNAASVTVKKDTAVEFDLLDTHSGEKVINGGVVNTSRVVFDSLNKDKITFLSVMHNGKLLEEYEDTKFTEDGKWEILVADALDNRAYFSFYILTKEQNGFEYITPYEYKISELWYDSGDGEKISYMQFVNSGDSESSFNLTENGVYTVLMSSDATGKTTEFSVKVNTVAPDVTLVGCANGETTTNDVTITGCKPGEVIRVYKKTSAGEKLIKEIIVNSASTEMPTINEGGEYKIVVESEAGVTTELNFVRKHVMNAAGSIFVIVIIFVAIVALFVGQIYRNKSKTDD